ncbi:MAG: glycogen/starch/alpha-glucan phosphorylase [Planctomycetes bacterium]|nr:glycogen/starch/alpha-glucan phosphorylase [Planctomycetota bacterium]
MTKTETQNILTTARDNRHDLDPESIERSFLNHIAFTQATVPFFETDHDRWVALALTVRDRLIERWIATRRAYYARHDTKRVYYLSLEYLVGRTLGNSLLNLNIYDECAHAMETLGLDLEEIREMEEEAALGNGGLGRLAACFLDSMATLQLPAYGYGIRYDYGMFHQQIRDGHQVEEPDDWLRLGNPWEVARPEDTYRISFGGRSEPYKDEHGNLRWRWVDTHDILALPYDTPVPGYGGQTVNTLRLFSTRAAREFDLDYFNHGDYMRACEERSRAENITKVLYPKDDMEQGRELRLQQEYLLVSASLQDILDRFALNDDDWSLLPERAAIQLNDTHPALAIPELMHLLMDRESLAWDEAWTIAVNTFAYTNHTVMPEAMERWDVDLLDRLLPRHLQIIYEINRRFLEQIEQRWPGDVDRARRMSLIDEDGGKRVRMAHLAIVGSHSVNGVSEVHTQILRDRVLRDFHELDPDKFNNKTNGITPRRWLAKANEPLSELISGTIGDDWVTDLEDLRRLVPFADDAGFRRHWRSARIDAKHHLRDHLRKHVGIDIDPGMMLDCHIKRFHDYKRQLLNLLHVVTLYNRLRAGEDAGVPRMVLFAGKAAPGYMHAKLTIKLANSIAEVVNNDPVASGRLHVAFVPNYGVSLAERIVAAADLSEQISTAGMEASGTGNMKFALNGALTIGTLDGANIEILNEVGEENFFVFGLTVEGVEQTKAAGYDPRAVYEHNAELKAAIDAIRNGRFSPGDPTLFEPLISRLLDEGDPYMVLADYDAYVQCQERVSRVYQDREQWTRMSILNTANMGRFSSDRTIREYADEIWHVQSVPVD